MLKFWMVTPSGIVKWVITLVVFEESNSLVSSRVFNFFCLNLHGITIRNNSFVMSYEKYSDKSIKMFCLYKNEPIDLTAVISELAC